MFDPWAGKIPLEEGMATHSSILAWRIPMDRGAWQAVVHGVTKSQTQLKQLNMGTVLIQHYYLPGIVLGEDVTASFAPH